MEPSPHALEQGRVDAVDFNSAIFTNLTGDHLDYHLDMENYFLAKSLLFSRLSEKASAIINHDDSYGQRLLSLTKGKIITYGLKGSVDVTACDIHLNFSGSSFTLQSPMGQVAVKTPLIGKHNIYNILAATAAALAQDVPLNEIQKGIECLTFVPGRLEKIHDSRDFHVFVDYAHTEDALRNVLMALRDVGRHRIILVFGCGGDRDKTKRPKMGRVASQLADFSIITSDNPRGEDAQAIVDEIISGVSGSQYTVILDREKAIHKALSLAEKNDIVLIAGKGHEYYQIFQDKTIDFDDREVVRKHLKLKHSV